MKADLNEILKCVEKRPGMYIHSYSIYDLSNFITGYECAIGMNSESKPKKEMSFMKWVEHKCQISNPAWHWTRILHHIAGNEKDAIKLFFEIWPDYINEKHEKTNEIYSGIYEPPNESVTNDYWNTIFNKK